MSFLKESPANYRIVLRTIYDVIFNVMEGGISQKVSAKDQFYDLRMSF
jgi:hypothetical protein